MSRRLLRLCSLISSHVWNDENLPNFQGRTITTRRRSPVEICGDVTILGTEKNRSGRPNHHLRSGQAPEKKPEAGVGVGEHPSSNPTPPPHQQANPEPEVDWSPTAD